MSRASMSPRMTILLERSRWTKAHYLKALMKYVDICEQPYTKENQRLDKRKNAADTSILGSMCPPISINVLPAGSSQQSIPTSADNAIPTRPGCTESIMVDVLLDVTMEEYTEWQQSRVSNETFSDNINKARDVTLENCLDVIQVYEDQDPSFFVKHGTA
ncbi:hypothetical protein N7463_005200 [Penicillium fimorum]|uniref:Uncharacterized protein n=1 Tax=Penicillium fimorum TaxID=1882269 RepID=A0A9X0C5F2_9EURO|nr:hypothetical protein N7463_005200 [Penicillium fimorum]